VPEPDLLSQLGLSVDPSAAPVATKTPPRSPEQDGKPGKAPKPANAKKGAKDKSPAEGEKKSKKKLVIILVVVLLLGAYMAKGKLMKVHYKPGQPVPLGKILPLDQSPLTVDLSDGHMLQAVISLQLTSVANSKVLTAELPRFDNAAITVFGAETYDELLPPQGRQAATQKFLQACQQVAGTVDGAAQQIAGIDYGSFVLQ
jgi:flagellar basal body-associated protein FliL